MPYHLFYRSKCDVTIYVTLTMTSLSTARRPDSHIFGRGSIIFRLNLQVQSMSYLATCLQVPLSCDGHCRQASCHKFCAEEPSLLLVWNGAQLRYSMVARFVCLDCARAMHALLRLALYGSGLQAYLALWEASRCRKKNYGIFFFFHRMRPSSRRRHVFSIDVKVSSPKTNPDFEAR